MDDIIKVLPKLLELGGILVIAGIAVTVMGVLLKTVISHNIDIQDKRAEERAANARGLEAATQAQLKQTEATDGIVAAVATLVAENKQLREKVIELIATLNATRRGRAP